MTARQTKRCWSACVTLRMTARPGVPYEQAALEFNIPYYATLKPNKRLDRQLQYDCQGDLG